jgi:hypothetical protein
MRAPPGNKKPSVFFVPFFVNIPGGFCFPESKKVPAGVLSAQPGRKDSDL